AGVRSGTSGRRGVGLNCAVAAYGAPPRNAGAATPFLPAAHELGEQLAPHGLAQLDQPAVLDLADALARQAELAGDLLQRPRAAVLQAEAHLQHGPVARRQRAQRLVQPGLERLAGEVLAGLVPAGGPP